MSQQGSAGARFYPITREVQRIVGQEMQGLREDLIVAINSSSRSRARVGFRRRGRYYQLQHQRRRMFAVRREGRFFRRVNCFIDVLLHNM